MAFENISSKLQNVFRKLTSKGKLNEAEVKEAMREIKLALLEADVNYLVVKDFIKKVTDRAVGHEVLDCLTPGQQVIKIVNEELTSLMGSFASKLDYGPRRPSVFLVCGLQGAGKTTFCAKLANYLKEKENKKCMLVACDVYRPAAIEQLKVLGQSIEVPVYEEDSKKPVSIAENALKKASHDFLDVVIVDTAGRLHIDEEMMEELEKISKNLKPAETLLVVDAMTGQDAVNIAQTFNEKINLSGVILSKLDGDTRGGAALSVKAVTGKPIKFVGNGEKISDIDVFHPDRMSSRILGMGDMLSLIEKAEQAFDEKKSAELASKLKKDTFTLSDFLDQLEQMKDMGSIEDMVGMIPGAGNIGNINIDEKQISHSKAIIQSMTLKERENPDILNASRRKRIAKGCGLEVQDVNRLVNQFSNMKKTMKMLKNRKFFKGKPGFPMGF